MNYAYCLCLLTLFQCTLQKEIPLKVEDQPIDAKVVDELLIGSSVLNLENYFVWGASVIKGKDKKYHMLFSLWEAGENQPNFSNSWVLNSKIGYAVSDFPDRDFEFKKIILSKRKDSLLWDSNAVHNPHIKKFNDKFYLYYIGNSLLKNPTIVGEVSLRNQLQQNQHIGVIEFSSFTELINGNFERPKKPILSPRTRVKPNNVLNPSTKGTKPKPDNLIVVNPAVVKRPSDGKYLLYFKGNIYEPNWKGVHGIAIGDSPTGPFTALDSIAFEFKNELGQLASAEDPFVWYHKKDKKFYAVLKDFSGSITNEIPGLALLESIDGIDFKQSKNTLFIKKQVKLTDGSVLELERLERPQILTNKQGNPIVLYSAAALISINQTNTGKSFNIQIPLKVIY